MNILHRHKWDYERHNALIIRSCSCGTTDEGIIIEEPELVYTAPMRKNDIDKVKWKRV